LRLRGSKRATDKRQAAEVRGPHGTPDCPEWLDADARAAWDQLLPMLQNMGILTRIDGLMLATFCRLWSRWKKAEAFIEAHGEVFPIKDDRGRVKCFMPWPQVAIAKSLAQQLTRLAQEFGMTPSARARLQQPDRTTNQPYCDDPRKARYFEIG
jgi:P27 family predicted phage terminase small subunit